MNITNRSTEKFLGNGTFGAVYKGVIDGKEYAFKVPCDPTDSNHMEDFKNEYEKLNYLKLGSGFFDSNIINLVGFSNFNKKPAMVLELFKQNLDEYSLSKETGLSLDWTFDKSWTG
jgi:serine/threonine protein kinase